MAWKTGSLQRVFQALFQRVRTCRRAEQSSQTQQPSKQATHPCANTGAPRDAQDFVVVAGGVKPLLQDARLLAIQAALLAQERGGKYQVDSCRMFACNAEPTPTPHAVLQIT